MTFQFNSYVLQVTREPVAGVGNVSLWTVMGCMSGQKNVCTTGPGPTLAKVSAFMPSTLPESSGFTADLLHGFNPYSPRYSYVSSANRDPGTHSRVG